MAISLYSRSISMCTYASQLQHSFGSSLSCEGGGGGGGTGNTDGGQVTRILHLVNKVWGKGPKYPMTLAQLM